MTKDNGLACEGCGRVDPCGVHYDDCRYLEPGDYIIPRKDADTKRDREQFAMLYQGA